MTEQSSKSQPSRQPVVLQVLPALVTGGVERGAVDVGIALAEAGWGSYVVSTGGPMVRELERAGAKHVILPVASKNPLVMRKNAERLAELAKEIKADIIHARSRAPAWSAESAARKAGCHFVTTFHGTYNLGPMALKRHYNAVMAKGERVIAISHFIASHIHQYYGVGWERVRVVPRGIDFDIFDPAHVSPERIIQLSTAWRLPDGVPVIMLPGRLTRWKGQPVLIEAMAEMRDVLGWADMRCLLVGSDQGRTDYREELLAQTRRLGLDDVVHVIDDCRDLPAAYMLSDVVVSASTDPEAFGRIIVEAQAMGRPVVASDHGGAKETVIAGETGWLVTPGDSAALAQSISDVLEMEIGLRKKRAEQAIQHARANFSKKRMCDETLTVYREVLNLGPSA
ncbi:MAG: glycosyltransferase family 4 protein [Alphaproteobacteria bacterium]|nr:glycosyltransferase family 4 protein [Alphaproteobacteria bacterium]